MKKLLVCCTLALALCMMGGQAYAWKIVYDPTNHSETLASKLQLIESYKKQLEQIQMEMAQLAKLDGGQLSESVNSIQEMVGTLNNIRQSMDAMGTDYRTAQHDFDEVYVDYQKWNGVAAEEYARQMQRVNQSIQKSVEQSIITAGLASPDEMQKTANSMQRLLEASQHAEGVVGVMQASNQIAALQIREIQRMQAIMSDSMRSQQLYMQKQIEAEKAAEKRDEEFMATKNDYNDVEFGTGSTGDLGHF